jgi:hypothetical protein
MLEELDDTYLLDWSWNCEPSIFIRLEGQVTCDLQRTLSAIWSFSCIKSCASVLYMHIFYAHDILGYFCILKGAYHSLPFSLPDTTVFQYLT